MLRICSPLLLSLVLLTTACQKKDDLQPAPILEGEWELRSTTIRVYGADSKLLSQGTSIIQTIPKETLRFTDSAITFSASLLTRELPTPIQVSTHPYTRQDSILRVTLPAFSSYIIAPLTITGLTNTTLTIEQRLTQPQASRLEGAVLSGQYRRKE